MVFYDAISFLLNPSQTMGPEDVSLFTSVPAPDSSLGYWYSYGLSVVLQALAGAFSEWTSGMLKGVWYHYELGPEDVSLFTSVPAPDSQVNYWYGFGISVEPFYPIDMTLGPRDTIYAGDMGFYIG